MIMLSLTASRQMAAQGRSMGLRSRLLVPMMGTMLIRLRRRLLPVMRQQRIAVPGMIQIVHPAELWQLLMRFPQP